MNSLMLTDAPIGLIIAQSILDKEEKIVYDDDGEKTGKVNCALYENNQREFYNQLSVCYPKSVVNIIKRDMAKWLDVCKNIRKERE